MLERPENEIWNYQQLELGFNYRLTDLQAALGLSQLKRLDDIIAKRNELAETYNSAFAMSPIDTQSLSPDTLSSFHLYIIRIKELQCGINQKKMYNILQANNINCNLHYIPVYRHPFYEKRGFKPDYCPNAEQYFKEAISIPLYPTLTEEHQSYVINVINTALRV
jgi:dTDP-4-amino-4,6-dideoxygalactose transaminase